MIFLDNLSHRFFRRPYRLHSKQWGQGPIVIVLVHGIAASGDIWSPLLKYLDPSRYTVIIPDLLGFGLSPKPTWLNYTVDDHARNVLALLKRKKIRAPFFIVGHSMGCLVATHIATKRKHMIRALFLYEPPLLGEIPDFPKHGKRSQRYKTVFEFIASHPQLIHVESRILWRIARKLWGTHMTEDEWVPFQRSLRNTILDQLAYDELRDVNIHTDIIYGRLDLMVIRHGIERMFAANKNIRLHLVTDFHGISYRSARFIARLIEAN